jgi:hypothetical protein
VGGDVIDPEGVGAEFDDEVEVVFSRGGFRERFARLVWGEAAIGNAADEETPCASAKELAVQADAVRDGVLVSDVEGESRSDSHH